MLTWFVTCILPFRGSYITSSLVPQDLSHWQLKIEGPVNLIGGLIVDWANVFQDKLLSEF